MVMDIMVLILFAGTVFFSMRQGFALTVVNFLRCVASLVLGFLFCDDVRDWLLANTGVGAFVEKKVQAELTASLTTAVEESDLYQMLPSILRKQSSDLTGMLAEEGILRLTHTFLTILSFFLIVLAVALVAALLSRIFSKQYQGGFLGFTDWLLGGVMGIISGLFYVFVFLAVITPLTAMFMPSLSETLAQSFSESRVAGDLYDNNFLLLFFRDFLN